MHCRSARLGCADRLILLKPLKEHNLCYENRGERVVNMFRAIFSRGQRTAEPDYCAYPACDTPHQHFTSATVNLELAQDGFSIFPWLSAAEVADIEAAVRRTAEDVDHGDVHIPTNFRLSAFCNDAAYKSRLYDSMHSMLAEKLSTLLPGYEPLVINLFEKHPQSGYDPVPIHQNPSFVDEPQHKSYSLWIPLQDVDQSNGTVGVLRASHNKFNTMRSGNMAHEDVFAIVGTALEQQHFEALTLKAGEVLALDDSIIHWSYPNESETVRRAVQLIMVPSAAKHIYYYYDDTAAPPMMDLYDVNKDFFFGFNCKSRPEALTHIGRVPYRYRPIQFDELALNA